MTGFCDHCTSMSGVCDWKSDDQKATPEKSDVALLAERKEAVTTNFIGLAVFRIWNTARTRK